MNHPHRASPPPTQSSPILALTLDDDNFEALWASASQPSQYTKKGPSEPVEDDSPVEEVAAMKPKRKYTRRRRPIKKNDKEFVEPWTIEEEAALCKAWVHASKNSVEGNGKKAVQEVRPMGRDATKKKKSSSGARLESSVAGDPSLVDALRGLELEVQRRREQGELERLKIAQKDKELELQQKMFEFQQQRKFEEDIKYYNEAHEHLTGRALSTALLLKKKIKER
ncbi:hypothetical protein Tco_0598848 [Tanacetum coccineum]